MADSARWCATCGGTRMEEYKAKDEQGIYQTGCRPCPDCNGSGSITRPALDVWRENQETP